MKKFSKWKNYKKLNIILTIVFLITFLTIMFIVNLSAASTNSGNFTVDYSIQSNWGSGAIVNVTITNNGATVEDWTTKWTFLGDEKIINMWSAEYKQNGNSVTVTNSPWNGTIQENSSISFGFIINYSGDISVPDSIKVTSSTNTNVEPTLEPTVEPTLEPTVVNTTSVPTVTSVITTPDSPEVETPSSLKSFPGAEGAGAYTSGGRDGDIYFVTNLKDSGPGSLREGVDTTPSEGRTILFKVSGTIKLTTGLQINKENITIAGQSAPGDGICISGKTVYIGKRPPRKVGEFLGNNIIIRHLRFRLSETAAAANSAATDDIDTIWVNSGENIMLDHLSTSWTSDEVLSASRDVKNLTVQHTLMTEPLNAKGHGFGSIIGAAFPTDISWHHNLYAHCLSRNPRPSSDAPDQGFNLDLRNNVVYNWGGKIGYNSSDDVLSINYINNYFIAGPNSSAKDICSATGNTDIYQSGNLYDGNKNGKVDGIDRGWNGGWGSAKRLSSPIKMPSVKTDSAGDAYIKVIANGGASPWKRDPVDKRVIDTVINQNGKIIDSAKEVGGYPTLKSETPPIDSDNDGMPDYWENAMSLDSSNPSDRKNKDVTGYTMLEGYLNWLGDGHAICKRNSSVDIDLRTLNGGLKILDYKVESGKNGKVTLLSDGHTVRFKAVEDFNGLANFTYSAVDPETGYGFDSVNVGVLITKE